MDKKSPFFTASVASVVYFVIFLLLKYFLATETIDWKGALTGAIFFWIVIFVVHKILERRYRE